MTRVSKIETYQVTKVDLKDILARELKVDPKTIVFDEMLSSGKRFEPPVITHDFSHLEVRING